MTTSTDTQAGPATERGARHRAGRRPGMPTALRWELAKLAAQARSRYTLLGCLLAPVAIVLVLDGQQRPPKDTLYGRHIHTSGYAMPLLLLAFAAQWLLPLLCSLVAGDIFASEDQHGTWKTILTRSVSRTQVFWAKTVTAVAFTLTAMVLLAASTIFTSLLVVGSQPLTGLTGQVISPHSALQLVIASWATVLPALVGFTALAILLSVLTRNPSVGVVGPVVLGLVMSLVGSLGGIDLPRKLLLTTPLESWHGLLTEHRFYGPLLTGLGVSAGWTVLCLALAFFSLRRRDFTGG
jgi:ABC-2 type transport system permease protein